MRVYQAKPTENNLFTLIPVGHSAINSEDGNPSAGDFVEYFVTKKSGRGFRSRNCKTVVAVVANLFFVRGMPVLVVGAPIATTTLDDPETGLMQSISFHEIHYTNGEPELK
jgi:hypothetical protein